MSLAQTLADYCARVQYDDIPAHVRTYAKHAIIDQIGVCLRAAHIESPSTFVSRFARLMGGVGEVRVFDSGTKVPLINAALANGAVAVGTALDGYHQPSATHLLALLVPVCVSVGEREAACGRDLITALVVGADVLSRVSKACGPSQLLARGFHPSSVCGPFGCAVAASKLLGLEGEQMAHALALAGVQGAGLTVWGGEEELSSYALQIGRAVQSGVVAALLARDGFTGCPTIFEHTCGFFASHAPEARVDELTRDLGITFDIYETTLSLYDFGVVIYTAADALLEILDQSDIRPQEIAGLSVGVPTRAIPLVAHSDYPISRGRAYVNIRYVLSVVAVLGERMRHGLDPGLEMWRRDPVVRSLFDKVSVYSEPSLDPLFPALMPAVVEVKTDAGRTSRKRFDGPTKGQPPHRLSEDDVMAKFRRNAGAILGPARTDAVLTRLRKLEEVDDVRALSDQLFAGPDAIQGGREPSGRHPGFQQ